jgi:hypothetical protein
LGRPKIHFEGGKATVDKRDGVSMSGLVLDIEEDTEWGLVRQHLKRDAFWRKYRQWKNVVIADLEARVLLKLTLAELLKKNTGYEYEDSPAEGNCLYYTAVDFLFQQFTFKYLDRAWYENFEKKIWIDEKSGEIKYAGSTTLAYARGQEKWCKEQIVAALDNLARSRQARLLSDIHQKTRRLTAALKKEAEELIMAGMLPGKCRVCDRIGK